jgi:glycine oxidase
VVDLKMLGRKGNRMTNSAQDVIIVGGGIIGCLTAYLLSREGLKVTVLEVDTVGSHASGFALGALWPLDGAGIPDPLLDFSLWSFQRHQTLAQELEEISGVSVQFLLRDRLSLAFDDTDLEKCQKELMWQRGIGGFKVEWLDSPEALKIEPLTNPACLGAVYVQGTATLEAYPYNLAASRAAEKFGVSTVLRGVTGLITKGDRCLGVKLTRGRLEAGAVVLAMGPWTQKASQWLRMNIPVTPLKGEIIRLQPESISMNVSLNYRGSYASPKPGGLIWAGTTEEFAGFDQRTTFAARDKIISDLMKIAPSLAQMDIVQQTACLRPLSGDGLPIVGKVPGWQNLYIGTGAGRQGILLSTGMSHGLTDIMTRGFSEIPGLSLLDPARFQGG